MPGTALGTVKNILRGPEVGLLATALSRRGKGVKGPAGAHPAGGRRSGDECGCVITGHTAPQVGGTHSRAGGGPGKIKLQAPGKAEDQGPGCGEGSLDRRGKEVLGAEGRMDVRLPKLQMDVWTGSWSGVMALKDRCIMLLCGRYVNIPILQMGKLRPRAGA